MAFPYERIDIPGAPPEIVDKFYEYVDIISELFFRERVNPLTEIPYCPNDDQKYQFHPLSERQWGNIDPHILRDISYGIQYTVPFQQKLNDPIVDNFFLFNINLQLKFSPENEFLDSNIWVTLQAREPYLGYQNFNMKIWDLHGRQEIIDGFRIFMGTFINFYVFPWDGNLQHKKIALLLEDYNKRHLQYLELIRETLPREIGKVKAMVSPNGPFHGIDKLLIREYYLDPIYLRKKQLLRDLSINGVPNIVHAATL